MANAMVDVMSVERVFLEFYRFLRVSEAVERVPKRYPKGTQKGPKTTSGNDLS